MQAASTAPAYLLLQARHKVRIRSYRLFCPLRPTVSAYRKAHPDSHVPLFLHRLSPQVLSGLFRAEESPPCQHHIQRVQAPHPQVFSADKTSLYRFLPYCHAPKVLFSFHHRCRTLFQHRLYIHSHLLYKSVLHIRRTRI